MASIVWIVLFLVYIHVGEHKVSALSIGGPTINLGESPGPRIQVYVNVTFNHPGKVTSWKFWGRGSEYGPVHFSVWRPNTAMTIWTLIGENKMMSTRMGKQEVFIDESEQIEVLPKDAVGHFCEVTGHPFISIASFNKQTSFLGGLTSSDLSKVCNIIQLGPLPLGYTCSTFMHDTRLPSYHAVVNGTGPSHSNHVYTIHTGLSSNHSLYSLVQYKDVDDCMLLCSQHGTKCVGVNTEFDSTQGTFLCELLENTGGLGILSSVTNRTFYKKDMGWWN